MKAFGIILLIVAAICGIEAFSQTQETVLERLNRDLASSSDSAARQSKAMGDFVDATAQLQGQRTPARYTRAEDSFHDSASSATADADRYKSERNQRMLLWLGGAAVCFLAGIICITTAKHPAVTSTPAA